MKTRMSDRFSKALNSYFQLISIMLIHHILVAYFRFRLLYMGLEYVRSLVLLHLNHLLEVRLLECGFIECKLQLDICVLTLFDLVQRLFRGSM